MGVRGKLYVSPSNDQSKICARNLRVAFCGKWPEPRSKRESTSPIDEIDQRVLPPIRRLNCSFYIVGNPPILFISRLTSDV